MKSRKRAGLSAIALSLSFNALADMPVIDFTAAMNAAQELQAWGQQAQQMQQQITTMAQQLQQIQMLLVQILILDGLSRIQLLLQILSLRLRN